MNCKFILTALLSITFSYTSMAQVYEGKQKHIDQILKNITAFSAHLVAGESDQLIDLYCADAKIFPAGKAILEGEDLKAYWAPRGTAKVSYHKVTPTEIKVVKKTAYDYGYYEGTTLFEDGKEQSWKGKYVIVWKLVNKEWKIYLDCWNRTE